MYLLLKLSGIVLFLLLGVLGLSIVEFFKWVNTDADEYIPVTELENSTIANIESET